MTSREDIDSMLCPLEGVIHQGGGRGSRYEEVCRERVIHLFLNDDAIVSLVASPAQLRELGAGFVISEGLASSVHRVEVDGDRVMVYGNVIDRPLEVATGSSGGLSTGRILRGIVSDITIDRDDIFTVMAGIVSELWERTGGAHCSVLFSGGSMVAKSSDVGRHNTVDKVVGRGILTGIDMSRCVLGCTGRQPAGMISKALNAGIPIIISKAATTDDGVELAREAGLTLVCRVKDGRFSVYSHPERIRGLKDMDREGS
ncbi:MAG TPA: formate dehydrogenase accessory sulfurtransferase FdhD [Deltaproteobacteria bacterium]|nr:formate dehydrogenase accessory sulfurtransferase FdhD [Deltaproteobacteria bacterium]HPR54788.1 formate dehydrogenase accessory sulfurtransferase FdhD [Deltaproteobacteria bacterium]